MLILFADMRDSLLSIQQNTLETVELGAGNLIKANSQISNACAGDGNIFGPFCYVRNNCIVGDNNIIGAYVEATRSTFGCNTRVSHRAFLGDAFIEDGVITHLAVEEGSIDVSTCSAVLGAIS